MIWQATSQKLGYFLYIPNLRRISPLLHNLLAILLQNVTLCSGYVLLNLHPGQDNNNLCEHDQNVQINLKM